MPSKDTPCIVLAFCKAVAVAALPVVSAEPLNAKSSVLSLSSYVTVIFVSVFPDTIAPTVSLIVSANVTPAIVIASASNVPSMSASPDMSSDPASNSPLMVIFLPPVMSLFESVIIALLAITVPFVIPSIRLMSVALAVTPSKMFSSATVDVIPSRAFISAAVAVTPSRIFSSAAVDVTAVPLIDSVVNYQ